MICIRPKIVYLRKSDTCTHINNKHTYAQNYVLLTIFHLFSLCNYFWREYYMCLYIICEYTLRIKTMTYTTIPEILITQKIKTRFKWKLYKASKVKRLCTITFEEVHYSNNQVPLDHNSTLLLVDAELLLLLRIILLYFYFASIKNIFKKKATINGSERDLNPNNFAHKPNKVWVLDILNFSRGVIEVFFYWESVVSFSNK